MSVVDVRPWLRMSTAQQTAEVIELMRYAEDDEQVDLQLVSFPTYVELCKITTAEEVRGHGHAGRVADALCEWADRHQAVLGLSPTDRFGADIDRLHWWYKRLGFRPNTLARWRMRSVKTTWLRLPKPSQPH